MNNKTVWNDPINLKKNIVHDNNSENFQIMNMEYKIKKIKNKKKKNGENYKKIPVFETIEVPIDNELLSIKQLNPAEIVDNISNSTNTDVNIIDQNNTIFLQFKNGNHFNLKYNIDEFKIGYYDHDNV